MGRRKSGRPPGRPVKPGLPSRPLADAVLRLAARSSLAETCKRAGIVERVVWRWRTGESGSQASLDLADQVLTRLGLCWWDVWNEDTVREPLFVVTTYESTMKKGHGGKYRRLRVKDRTVPYGDLGTDYWRLREIKALMAGEAVLAA